MSCAERAEALTPDSSRQGLQDASAAPPGADGKAQDEHRTDRGWSVRRDAVKTRRTSGELAAQHAAD
jgi:hypothetical protein